MRILFFHRWVGVHSGGTETHLFELATRFCERGHKITILTREGNRLLDLDKRIKVLRISRNFNESDHSYDDFRVYIHTGLFMLKAVFKLFLLMAYGERFDIISVHFSTEAVVARVYRFFTKTPFVFVLEGYTTLEAKTARHANKRIAISNFEAEVYRKRHDLKSEVIYIGIDFKRFLINKNDLEKFRAQFAKNNQILILSVCRLEPRKDIFTLIEAAKLVNKENPNIKFIIAGDGILRADFKKNIEQNHLSPFVNLIGFVNDADLPYYYGASDIFVLTSKEEWFGIVFLEAMAAGLPIITTNVDACPEIVDGCGLFFEKGDYDGLKGRIIELADNLKLRNDLSLKAKNRAAEFDWNNQILLYEKAYKSVLEEYV